MLHKKTAQKGFTIVELLIVIVVIGILAALVLNTFTGVQKRARDTDRQNDIAQLATQLEVYYNDNGKYPTVANLQDAATSGWIKTNLKGLDLNATIAPGVTPAANANSVVATASANKDQYGYQPVDSGSGVCDNTATEGDCVKFTLTYTKEELKSGETNPISKASLN